MAGVLSEGLLGNHAGLRTYSLSFIEVAYGEVLRRPQSSVEVVDRIPAPLRTRARLTPESGGCLDRNSILSCLTNQGVVIPRSFDASASP